MDSLNEIRLTPQMITDLYGQSLIAPIDNTRVKKPLTPTGVRFLGSNKRNIVMIVNDPGHTFLPESELTFLTRMLDACKLNLADVAIVNLAAGEWSLSQVREQLSPSTLLVFGGSTTQELFSIVDTVGIPMLTAPSLGEMAGDNPEAKNLKTRLWGALKQLFRL